MKFVGFKFWGVIKGSWQLKVHDNELLWCLGILKGIIWDSIMFRDFLKDFVVFGKLLGIIWSLGNYNIIAQ